MSDRKSPYLAVDSSARALARTLLLGARHAALGVFHPDKPYPFVSRVALSCDALGQPFLLVSDIALHARAMATRAEVSLMVAEPDGTAEPLAQPRLTILANAMLLPPLFPEREELRQIWQNQHKNAHLYLDLPDFHFVRLTVASAFLNAGFGRAYALTAEDLGAES